MHKYSIESVSPPIASIRFSQPAYWIWWLPGLAVSLSLLLLFACLTCLHSTANLARQRKITCELEKEETEAIDRRIQSMIENGDLDQVFDCYEMDDMVQRPDRAHLNNTLDMTRLSRHLEPPLPPRPPILEQEPLPRYESGEFGQEFKRQLQTKLAVE
jgi:hypothetical protein